MKRVLSIWQFLTQPLFAKRIFVRAVILQDGDLWAVQGLEYDIAAQGRTVHDAMEAFCQTVIAWIDLDLEKGREPLSALSKGPAEFWEMFERGVEVTDPHKHARPAFARNVVSRQELRLCA